MRAICYLRGGVVYMPVLGRVSRGPYRDTGDLTVVPVSDGAGLRRAFRETIARGNPVLPDGPPDNSPSPLLAAAKVKSWGALYRSSVAWAIETDDRSITPYRPRQDRGLEEDKERRIVLPEGSTVDDLIDRFISILQAHGKA